MYIYIYIRSVLCQALPVLIMLMPYRPAERGRQWHSAVASEIVQFFQARGLNFDVAARMRINDLAQLVVLCMGIAGADDGVTVAQLRKQVNRFVLSGTDGEDSSSSYCSVRWVARAINEFCGWDLGHDTMEEVVLALRNDRRRGREDTSLISIAIMKDLNGNNI